MPVQKFRAYRNATLIIMETDGWDKFVNTGLATTIILVVALSLKAIAGG